MPLGQIKSRKIPVLQYEMIINLSCQQWLQYDKREEQMKATEASFAVAVYLCTYSEGFKLRCSRILDSHGVHSLYFNFPFPPLDSSTLQLLALE